VMVRGMARGLHLGQRCRSSQGHQGKGGQNKTPHRKVCEKPIQGARSS
jgi:hypothetical protein